MSVSDDYIVAMSRVERAHGGSSNANEAQVTSSAALEYLAKHNLTFVGVRCGAIDVTDETIAVCCGIVRSTAAGQTIGFRIERIANSVAAVRAYLGY